jgi:hypothetical protein
VRWLALGAAVVLAALTRLLVERPIRYSPSRQVPAVLIAVFLLIGGLAWLASRGYLLPARLQAQAGMKAAGQFDLAGIARRDCSGIVPADSAASRFCTAWGPEESPHSVVVWGDSMSGAWMPPFLTLVREHGWHVVQFSHPACPPIIGVHRTDASFAKEWCNDGKLQPQIIEAIQRMRPRTTFLIARWNLYYHGHIKDDVLVENSFITDESGDASPGSAAAALARRLPETVARLGTFSRVVIFKDTPVLKVPIELGLSNRAGGFEPGAREHADFEHGINQVIDAAVAQTPGTSSFDPGADLCDANRCSAFLDGLPAFSDEAHVTAHAALHFLSDIQSLEKRP